MEFLFWKKKAQDASLSPEEKVEAMLKEQKFSKIENKYTHKPYVRGLYEIFKSTTFINLALSISLVLILSGIGFTLKILQGQLPYRFVSIGFWFLTVFLVLSNIIFLSYTFYRRHVMHKASWNQIFLTDTGILYFESWNKKRPYKWIPYEQINVAMGIGGFDAQEKVTHVSTFNIVGKKFSYHFVISTFENKEAFKELHEQVIDHIKRVHEHSQRVKIMIIPYGGTDTFSAMQHFLKENKGPLRGGTRNVAVSSSIQEALLID